MVELIKRGLNIEVRTKNKHERSVVKSSLTFFHPEAINIPAFMNDKWDGYVRYYKRGGFSVGFLGKVKRKLKKKGIEYKLVGFKSDDLSWVKFGKFLMSDDRDYQREAVLSALKNKFGIIKLPTRTGKTYIAGEFLRLLCHKHANLRVIIYTDVSDMVKQIKEDLALLTGKNVKEFGTVQGEKVEIKDITVVMIQTVTSAIDIKTKKLERKKQILKMIKDANVVIVDEIHEFSSKNRLKAIRLSRKKEYLMCLSATPKKKSDKMGWLSLLELTGGVIYVAKEVELRKKGVLANYKLLLLVNNMQWDYKHENMSYRELEKDLIINNKKRNNVIKNVSKICDELSLKTIVMLFSKAQGYLLEKLTGLPFMHGDHILEVRDYVKKWFLGTKGNSIIVSHIWKKGLTLPEVEVYINGSGGKENSMIIQKKGRVLGVTDTKKKALIIDFIDIYDRYFSDHSWERLTAYNANLGEEDMLFVDIDNPKYKKIVKEFIKEWFNS